MGSLYFTKKTLISSFRMSGLGVAGNGRVKFGVCYKNNNSGRLTTAGELAHMVERSLSMREVPGSMPGFSTFFSFFFFLLDFFHEW